jgi:hypothetical protein
VKHVIDTFAEIGDTFHIQEIKLAKVNSAGQLRQVFTFAGFEVVESPNFFSATQEFVSEVRSNKTGDATDQIDSHDECCKFLIRSEQPASLILGSDPEDSEFLEESLDYVNDSIVAVRIRRTKKESRASHKGQGIMDDALRSLAVLEPYFYP